MGRLTRHFKNNSIRTGAEIAGGGCIAIGAWEINPIAGLIVGGVVLWVLAAFAGGE